MMEGKAGVAMQIPRKDSKPMSMPASWRKFLWFRIRLYFKVAGQTRKIQSSSKLRQVRKWQAEILDTLQRRRWGSFA